MRNTVVIESRHLDTDERERVEVEVAPATDEPGQRRQLVELVARHRPGARLRSFADGAATFLDAQHLVIAAYSPRLATRRVGSRGEDAPQDALFAA
ncbi:MAG: hypothetical protein WD844_16010 [Thermoleophilaceae bacterium]